MKSTNPRSQQKNTKTKTVKALVALAESKLAFPLMLKAAETGNRFLVPDVNIQDTQIFGVSRPTVSSLLFQ